VAAVAGEHRFTSLNLSHWSERDWERLQEQRNAYLGNGKVLDWDAPLLKLYDESLALRIAWKWLELWPRLPIDFVRKMVGVSGQTLLDWGCGSGVALETLLHFLRTQGEHLQASPYAYDQSQVAVDFVRQKFDQAYDLSVQQGAPRGGYVLMSHVLSELSDADLNGVIAELSASQGFVWIDAGTPKESQKLVKLRNALLGTMRPVFPCPHSLKCPLHEGSDWCHFFALPPAIVHQDRAWREFSRRMGMDLRRQAYSVLAMTRLEVDADRGGWRPLGRPEFSKGQADVLVCHEGRIWPTRFQKREDPELFRAWQKGESDSWLKLDFVPGAKSGELKSRSS
jgi:hypothetical protein